MYIDDIYDAALTLEISAENELICAGEEGGFCLYIKIFNYINEFVLSLNMFM